MFRPLALFALLLFASVPVQAVPEAGGAGVPRSSISALHDLPIAVRIYPPEIIAPIPDLTRQLDEGPFSIDLDTVFSNPRDGSLKFSTRTSDSSIATSKVHDNILEVTPLAAGSVEIHVIATDERKKRKRDTFVLTVTQNAPPRLASNKSLSDTELTIGQDAYAVSLQGLFVDPDDDELIFEVRSSDPAVSNPTVVGAVLYVPATNIGETTITVVVDDQRGGKTTASFRVVVISSYPAAILITIDRTFGDPDSPASYRLVALPGNQYTAIKSVAQGLPDVDWMAYAADTLSRNELQPYDGSEAFDFRPGRGLWFLQKEKWTLPYRNLPTVPLRPDGTFTISLYPGWNIISNPFREDIPWENVASLNGVSQNLWRWEDGYIRVDTFFSAIHLAEAFYYYNAEARDSLTLPHPYFARSTFARKTNPAPIAKLMLSARGEDNISTSIGVGFGALSDTGLDASDQFAPPGYFSSLELSISNPNPDFGGRKLAYDQRPPLEDFARFDITLSAAHKTAAYIEITGLEAIGAEAATLVNLVDTRRYDLRDRSSIRIPLDGTDVPLALLLGRREAVEAHTRGLTPSTNLLLPNYPNPFNLRTTFEFALSTAQHVELSIYDTMGRRIATLLQGEQKAGLHRLTWEGYDDANRRLANGVYFYRLRSRADEMTRTLILLR